MSRRSVPMVTLAGCSLAGLYWIALEPFGARRESLVFSAVFGTLLIVHGMTLLNCRSEGLALGFERRLYRLPMSTPGLVIWRMVPAALLGAAMYLATAGFMKLVLGTRWPVLGPTAISITCLVWMLALNWSLGRRPYLLAPVGLAVAVPFVLWLKPRFQPGAGELMANWGDFGAMDLVLLALAVLMAVMVAIVGVRADRAEPRTLQSLVARNRVGGRRAPISETMPRRKSRSRAGFRSATGAQLWMEWREKGVWVSLWAALGLIFCALAGGFPEFLAGPTLRNGLLFIAMLLVLAPPAAGFLHGRSNLSSRDSMLDRVRATRPLSDRTLAMTLLLATFVTTAAAWLVAILTLTGVFVVTWLWGDTAKVEEIVEGLRLALQHSAPADLALAGLLMIGFCVAASGLPLSLVLSGRSRLTEGLAAPYVLVILGLIFERITGSDAWRRLLPYPAVMMLTMIPVASGVCAWLCYRRGHYSLRALIRGGLAFVTLAILLVFRFPFLQQAFVPGGLPFERAVAYAAPATLSAAFLPFVLAPLMLAWNRHR